MKFGLPDITIENIQTVFENNTKVDEVIVFGSRAKDNYKEGSDIDLAVKGSNISFDDILKLHGQLDDLNLPYKIDLLDYTTIKEKALVEHIDRVGILFYERWKQTEFGSVASNWSFIPASQYCFKVTDGTHDSPKEQKAGKHLITSRHIKERNIDFENAYKISEDDFNKINLRSKVDQWDVIISMIGEYCGFSYVERNNEIDYAVKNVGLFKTGDEIKAFWLFYFLNSKIGKSILEASKSGTSQPYITLNALRELPILIPKTETEKIEIINVLSSLDDKIDLLQRQNKTLEQLAETLFRQWFVEEADESWEITSLDKVAVYLNGLALQKFPVKGNDYLNVIKIRELKQGISENTDTCSSDISKQYVVHDGDILFSWSGSLEVVIWYDGDGALNQHLFKVTSDKYPKWFYYLATKSHLQNFRTIAETKSTTMGHIQREHLSQALISIPPDDLFKQYDESISPLVDKIINNNFQIKQLTQLRDALLPKLMSGEVRVEI